MEIWRNAASVGFPSHEVSTLGRVRSLNYMNTGKTQEITPRWGTSGYLQVQLNYRGKQKTFLLHRLVALIFIPNPENKPEVNHKDFDRSRCIVDNLEWATRSENEQHKAPRISGENTRKAKLTWDDVDWIRSNYRRHSQDYNMYAIARKFGVAVNCIRNILHNKTWKDHGWEFK